MDALFSVAENGIYYAKAAAYIGAAIAVSVSAFGAAIGQAMVGTKACEGVGKYAENSSNIRGTMLYAMILIETCAIYGLLIALLIIYS